MTRRGKRERTDEASTIECEVDSIFSDHVATRNNDEGQGLMDDGGDVSFESSQN